MAKQKKEFEDQNPLEKSYTGTLHDRGTVRADLDNDTFLLGPDGKIDTSPVSNITDGANFNGSALLKLKGHQNKNGLSGGEYISAKELRRSGVPAQKDAKPVILFAATKNPETGEIETRREYFYHVKQSQDPEGLKAWAAGEREKKQFEDARKHTWPGGYFPKGPAKGAEITCSSTDPEQYLGQYFAAVATGAKFNVTPEQHKEFKEKFAAALDEKTVVMEDGTKRTNPFRLAEICANAQKNSAQIEKDIRMEQRLANLEQQLNQSQGRSR